MTAAIYKFFNNRINLLLLGFALFPLFFAKYVESLCDQYLKPVYLNLSSNWIVDLVSLCLCVLIVLYYLERYKKEHLLSTFRVWLLVIGTGWYIYFRFQTGWNYGHFSFWDSLYYLDSIIFLCGVNLLYCLFSTKWFKDTLPPSSNENKKRFLTDQSLEFDTSDYLGRKEYANSITTTILNTLEKDHHTFAIGIVGEWGAGKTSFFTMMKASEDIKNGKAICIDFNPWLNHQNKDIVGNFFAELKEILGERDSKLAFQLDQYVKQLTTLDDNIYLKTIDFLTKLIFGTKSIKTIFSDINDSIARLKKTIIIFIDDLDRLDSSELVEVIKLIRISANFKNTAFVAAYDKEYVNKAIEAITKHNQGLFLEKIFQAEFHLPTFDAKRLKNYLSWELRQVVEERFYKEVDSYLSSEQLIFNKSILTMRDAKRFVNQFQIDFNQVKDEVLFSDFMNLALIKYKHFGLYEYIKKSNSSFLELHSSSRNEGIIFDDFYKIDTNKIELAEEGKQMVIRLFQRQLGKLNFETEKSILNPLNTDTYFSLRLLDGRLSSKDFLDALKNNDKARFLDHVIDWINSGNHKIEVYEKLKFEGDFNEEDYIKILHVALACCIHNCTEEYYYEYNFEELDLVRTVLKNGRKHRNKTKIVDIVKDFLSEDGYVSVKANIIDANIDFNSILTLEERIELILKMLKGLLLSSDKFYTEIWDVYGCTKDDEIARGLILDFAKEKDIKGLFREILIKKRKANQWKLNFRLINKLFDNYQTGIMSLTNDLESSKLKEVLLSFFDKYFDNNLDNEYVEFDFEGQLDWEFGHE